MNKHCLGSFIFSKAVMLKPVTLGCGHSGCHNCLKSNLRYQEQKGNSKARCPICRINQYDSTSLTVNIALDSCTRELAMRCINNGCAWKGSYQDAERHDQECLHRLVICQNRKCQAKMERRELASHLSSCGKQLVKSTDCAKEIERDQISRHQESGCLFSMISCPLGCGMSLLW